MLQINGKTFMNLQEAVQWLLDNNALPFQSSANYVANTEIGMGTIVNPSPAKVRIGSLIFFADSKVSTVIGLTENGFIVSDQYNDLVDDIVYVSNVQLNASGHLIVTLSNGDDIDAGLIKQVSGFSINASQHLIVSFNDGTSTDLGAIFNGNISISGNLTVSGGITGANITETMSGYSYSPLSTPEVTVTKLYAGAVKTGNKLTLVVFQKFTRTASTGYIPFGTFTIPQDVADAIVPFNIGAGTQLVCEIKSCVFIPNETGGGDNTTAQDVMIYKPSLGSNGLVFRCYKASQFTANQEYLVRAEVTFLLSNSL